MESKYQRYSRFFAKAGATRRPLLKGKTSLSLYCYVRWNWVQHLERLTNTRPQIYNFAFFFMATPTACRHSQGQITAAAEACTTAMAMPKFSLICDLCCSLQQHWILNPLNKARDQTHILMETTSGPYSSKPPWELQHIFAFILKFFRIIRYSIWARAKHHKHVPSVSWEYLSA